MNYGYRSSNISVFFEESDFNLGNYGLQNLLPYAKKVERNKGKI
jgi:hypothetical protein